ncbi:hypothetical protein JW921_01215 [Candidatus Fermentibacterales bacterium]|nr:hypothetical protein [Candidatus Fermentibacterales bacterium]
MRGFGRVLLAGLAPLLLVVPGRLDAANIQYDIQLSQYKESSTLKNSLSVVQYVSENTTLSASASFSATRSKDLDRFSDFRNGSASISYRPVSSVELSANLQRQIDIKERYGDLISDQLQNTATGQIRCNPLEWLSLQVSLGTHFEEYETVSGDSLLTGDDRGSVSNVSIGVNHKLTSRISASLSFLENRTMGRQTDRNQDDLSARMSYSFPALFQGGSLMAEIGASRQQVVYHDSSYSNNLQSYHHSFTVTCPVLSPGLSVELGTDWSWHDKFWESQADTVIEEDVRDRLEQTRRLTGRALWEVLDNLSIEFSLMRSISRTDRKQLGTGVPDLFEIWEQSDTRSFLASLVYQPGSAKITFDRVVELFRYDTFGTWEDVFGNPFEDNYDRDELRESMSLRTELPVSGRLDLKLVLQAQRRETIYIYGEQSGNNKTSSTYSAAPSASYDLGGGWRLDELVELSADYTTFTYPEYSSTGNNLLFRRVESVLSCRRVSADSTQLGITNRFRFQDQGSYENSVYERSEERISDRVTVYAGFHIRSDLGITPSYSYEYSERRLLGSSLPPSVDQLSHVGVDCRMRLGEGNLQLNATRTFYSDDRPSYWTASAAFNYLF